MKKEKKQSTGLTVAVVVFGIVDAVALALLVASLLISPAKGKDVEAQLPADFQENFQEYGSVDMTADYPSTATVVYGGSRSNSDQQEDSSASTPATEDTDDSEMIDTSDDPYAGFVFPDSDTTVISKKRMNETLTSKSLCRRAINEIYARHGYQFSKQENTDYFNQYEWYRNMPKETDMSVVASHFTSAEKKNVEALQAYEDSKSWS